MDGQLIKSSSTTVENTIASHASLERINDISHGKPAKLSHIYTDSSKLLDHCAAATHIPSEIYNGKPTISIGIVSIHMSLYSRTRRYLIVGVKTHQTLNLQLTQKYYSSQIHFQW